jgi:hypothetical protein
MASGLTTEAKQYINRTNDNHTQEEMIL